MNDELKLDSCPFCGSDSLVFTEHSKQCFLRMSEEKVENIGALIDAYRSRHTPDDMVMVPKVPTDAMLDAGAHATDGKLYPQDMIFGPRMALLDRYKAMIEAAK